MWFLHFYQHYYNWLGSDLVKEENTKNVGIYVNSTSNTIVNVEFTIFPTLLYWLGSDLVSNLGVLKCWDLCKKHIIHYSKCGIYHFSNIIILTWLSRCSVLPKSQPRYEPVIWLSRYDRSALGAVSLRLTPRAAPQTPTPSYSLGPRTCPSGGV